MKTRMKVLIALVAILSLLTVSVSAYADQMKRGHSGWKYLGPVYKTITTQYWGQCQTACLNDYICMSFTYGRYSKKCQLRDFIPGPKARQLNNNYISGVKIRR